MTEDSQIRYEMSWNKDGVLVSKYDLGSDDEELIVLDEWWYTWTELFTLITGEEQYSPHIV